MSQEQQPRVDDLQFRRADFGGVGAPGVKCTACQQDTGPSYFQVGGTPICAACAEIWKRQQGKPGFGATLRGSMFGFGGALAGGMGVGLISAMTGFQLAIAAIGVGWLVGRAFRIGTGGLGGRQTQAAAAVLAYFGICMSYAPVIWKALGEKAETRDPIVRFVSTAFVAIIAPVLELVEGGGVSGLLGILIVAFGVMQAWRMMARDERALSGPYSTKPEPEPEQAQ